MLPLMLRFEIFKDDLDVICDSFTSFTLIWPRWPRGTTLLKQKVDICQSKLGMWCRSS